MPATKVNVDTQTGKLPGPRVSPAFPEATLVPQGEYAHFETVSVGRLLTIIGASPQVHLRLRSRTISKRHAVLLNVDGRVTLCDLGSRTHVYVNDRFIRRAVLKDGDLIRIGCITFKFIAGPRGEMPPSPPAPSAQLRLASGRVATLHGPIFILGRRRDCDLVLPGTEVGRAHAMIAEAFGHFFIIHLAIHRRTLVEGVELDEQVLREGQIIEIGEHQLRYEIADSPSLAESYTDVTEEPMVEALVECVGTGTTPEDRSFDDETEELLAVEVAETTVPQAIVENRSCDDAGEEPIAVEVVACAASERAPEDQSCPAREPAHDLPVQFAQREATQQVCVESANGHSSADDEATSADANPALAQELIDEVLPKQAIVEASAIDRSRAEDLVEPVAIDAEPMDQTLSAHVAPEQIHDIPLSVGGPVLAEQACKHAAETQPGQNSEACPDVTLSVEQQLDEPVVPEPIVVEAVAISHSARAPNLPVPPAAVLTRSQSNRPAAPVAGVRVQSVRTARTSVSPAHAPGISPKAPPVPPAKATKTPVPPSAGSEQTQLDLGDCAESAAIPGDEGTSETSMLGEAVVPSAAPEPTPLPSWVQRSGPLALALAAATQPQILKKPEIPAPQPSRKGRSKLFGMCLVVGVALIGAWCAVELYHR